jgi:hypothetical protein
MSGAWQELLAYVAVALAAAWLALRWHRRSRPPGARGDRNATKACDGCHATTPRVRGRLHLPVVDPK